MPTDQTLPATGAAAPLPQVRGVALSGLERDYLALAIFVRVQHRQYDDALALVDALIAMDPANEAACLSRAVIHYQLGRHHLALRDLEHLDRIAPTEVMSQASVEERSRMRSFLKAKCSYVLDGALGEEGRASLDFYLRQKPKVVPS